MYLAGVWAQGSGGPSRQTTGVRRKDKSKRQDTPGRTRIGEVGVISLAQEAHFHS